MRNLVVCGPCLVDFFVHPYGDFRVVLDKQASKVRQILFIAIIDCTPVHCRFVPFRLAMRESTCTLLHLRQKWCMTGWQHCDKVKAHISHKCKLILFFILLTVAQRKGNQMLPSYHPGFDHQRKWTCCGSPYEQIGCTLTGTPPTHEGGVCIINPWHACAGGLL